jgi:hypothetical protein
MTRVFEMVHGARKKPRDDDATTGAAVGRGRR